MPAISVVMNTCNEAPLLRECVESVRSLADEIIVTDMESTDGSADVAAQLGCRVVPHPRRPAAEPEARIAAIQAARGSWILVMDPDMRLPKETAERLKQIAERDEADYVDFHMHNYFLGRPCLHGHGSQPVFRKFFKKSAFCPQSRHIHTFWHDSLLGRGLRLDRKYFMIHLGYTSFSQAFETLVRYARREAQDLKKSGKSPSLLRAHWRPMKRFLGNYLWRLGFLDGMAGLILNALVSFNVWMAEILLWEAAHYRGDERP
jgi:glycosyltransferase involved in cell wall biosynthesis